MAAVEQPRMTTQERPRKNKAPGARPDKRRAAVDSDTLEEQCHPRKVFIGGLAHKTTTQQLRDHFVSFGAIVDAVVLRWPDGRSRGFGYITFSDVASANAVLQSPSAHRVGGREVDVKRAVPGTNKIFVGGLPQNTTANEMREHFEKFGVVSDAVVMIDPATNRSRGFGFVCFLPGQEGATAVAAALERYEHHRIRGKWIEVKSAAPPHKLMAKEPAGSGAASSTSAVECSDRDVLDFEPQQPIAPCGRPVASPQKRQTHLDLEPRKVALPSSMADGSMADGADGYCSLSAALGLGSPSSLMRNSQIAASMYHDQPYNVPWMAPPMQSSPWNPYGQFLPGVTPEMMAAYSKPQLPASDMGYGGASGNAADLSVSESLQRNLEQLLRSSGI